MKKIKRKLEILKKRTIKTKIKTIKRKIEIFKKRKIKKKLSNFFEWVKGAELVELKSCNINEANG